MPKSDASQRGQQAEKLLSEAFSKAGWRVLKPKDGDSKRPDMLIRRGKTSYAVELKSAAEGRSDRLIPLWSQAYLQAHRLAHEDRPVLAVVAAPRIPRRAAEQVVKFAADYAPAAAVGVLDFAGLRLFRGPHLEGLDSEGTSRPASGLRSASTAAADIFSDLNQWMLKVLLAPDVPEKLLSAPRGRYRNASELARASNVSVMSAFRFIQQLQREGYLDEASPYLTLVRREDLLGRWQSVGRRRVVELPARFLLRGNPKVELKRILQGGRACLALFAAAEALRFGFVHGVPPYVYVQRLRPGSIGAWKNLALAGPGEAPDLILRQAPAPESVFRGLVRIHDVPVADIVQVWLDVSGHSSRGEEQAALIWQRMLSNVAKAPKA